MGRHRRATTPPPAAHPEQPEAAETRPERAHGRHRAGPAASPPPIRTGLLGAAAALALGVVAVTSGLVPGIGDRFTLSNDHGHKSVQAGGASHAAPRGGSSGPSDRASRSAAREDLDRRAAPSGTGSPQPTAPSTGSDRPTPPSPSTPASKNPDGSGTAGPTSGGERSSDTPRTDGGTTGASSRAGGGEDPGATAESRVLDLVNDERERAGCAPVKADGELATLAEDHSEDMAARDYFSHTTPDGRDPWDRAEQAGIDDLGGENIAMGQQDAAAVMDSWMNSSGHRRNILNCDFTTLGVGAHFGQGGPWWTQDFGY
ncbi:CAP domain-containing protein [Streptomyces sp. TR02-1]|uniref:CAP domain-containing protein n=1 Tax=Streptomyces sp. TR02-1 TaxID=3385977 RepID=UPI0039A165D2